LVGEISRKNQKLKMTLLPKKHKIKYVKKTNHMKSNYLKASILSIVIIFTISCTKDESTSTTETSGSSITISNTSAKFTVRTSAGMLKPNYIVMMFDQPFDPSAVLLASSIIKQVTTDANGIANFDLNTIVTHTTEKKYYFEAFIQTPTGFELKTNFSRFSVNLNKGNTLVTSLIVN
jgi:hypothetical protein